MSRGWSYVLFCLVGCTGNKDWIWSRVSWGLVRFFVVWGGWLWGHCGGVVSICTGVSQRLVGRVQIWELWWLVGWGIFWWVFWLLVGGDGLVVVVCLL